MRARACSRARKCICAGYQRNSSLSICTSYETVVIVVTLPMSQAAFLASEESYIQSISTTAGVSPADVEILSINEISSRTFRVLRLLLATAVRVQTSVLLASSQMMNMENQSLLNSNLNQHGLPSGTLVVQNTGPSALNISSSSTDATVISPVSEISSASNIPTTMIVGAAVGAAVGFVILIAGVFLIRRAGIFLIRRNFLHQVNACSLQNRKHVFLLCRIRCRIYIFNIFILTERQNALTFKAPAAAADSSTGSVTARTSIFRSVNCVKPTPTAPASSQVTASRNIGNAVLATRRVVDDGLESLERRGPVPGLQVSNKLMCPS